MRFYCDVLRAINNDRINQVKVGRIMQWIKIMTTLIQVVFLILVCGPVAIQLAPSIQSDITSREIGRYS